MADRLPRGLPLAYNSFNFDGDKPAERYVLPTKHHLLAPSQITIPLTERGYEDVLNVEGYELLTKTRGLLHTAKAVLRGELKVSRTGTVFHPNGCIELCSWYNRIYTGDVVSSTTEQLPPNKKIDTSVVILYEIDDKGDGWILTKSGSIYITTH